MFSHVWSSTFRRRSGQVPDRRYRVERTCDRSRQTKANHYNKPAITIIAHYNGFVGCGILLVLGLFNELSVYTYYKPGVIITERHPDTTRGGRRADSAAILPTRRRFRLGD
jgi:hypothetical protein